MGGRGLGGGWRGREGAVRWREREAGKKAGWGNGFLRI